MDHHRRLLCAASFNRLYVWVLFFLACSSASVSNPAHETPAAPVPAVSVPAVPAPPSEAEGWTQLAPGLEYGSFLLPENPVGDRRLRVVRARMKEWNVDLKMASADGPSRTAEAWGEGAVAVINSSMFAEDMKSSIGRMQRRGHINHALMASQQNSLLAADPLKKGIAPFHLYNLGCESLSEAEQGYALLVQSIRMLGCKGENVWSDQPRIWSAALVGEDTSGNLLFLHSRSPYRMHALVDALKALPLSLRALHYAEGGPEATLYLHAGTMEQTFVGSYETQFWEDDSNQQSWALPNVLRIVARK